VAGFSLVPRARLSLRKQHRSVLCEIDAALVALTSVPLFVLARRARESERMVALNAELDRFQVLMAAFAALHCAIIPVGLTGHCPLV
jgi:hypothetical protein